MTIKQLNNQFSISDQLSIIEGKGGLPMINVQNAKVTALISIYAGQVLSFRSIGVSEDLLFATDKAFYEDGKAIKGGIPICWPWFGPDPEARGRAAHGIARTRLWCLQETGLTNTGDVRIILALEDNAETRAIWPYRFKLSLEIILGDRLTLRLNTLNTGNQTFTITQALHSYFRVGDITQARLLGLEDSPYIDKLDEDSENIQLGAVEITQALDRIYRGAPDELLINDAALQRRVMIHSEGHQTVVVWNPWTAGCAAMQDLADEDYQDFLCVETSNAADNRVEIAPGDEYCLMASYHIISGCL